MVVTVEESASRTKYNFGSCVHELACSTTLWYFGI